MEIEWLGFKMVHRGDEIGILGASVHQTESRALMLKGATIDFIKGHGGAMWRKLERSL